MNLPVMILSGIGIGVALVTLLALLARRRVASARMPLPLILMLLLAILVHHVVLFVDGWHIINADNISDLARVAIPLLLLVSVLALMQKQRETVQRSEERVRQQKVEEALRSEAERLRRIVGNMPVMLDAFDDQGNIIFWNDQCEQVTGYSAKEMVGNPRAMELLYPDAAYRESMLSQWKARSDDYVGWEWDLTCKDGTVRTIAWSNVARKYPIPDWATWGIGVDLTALRQAQRTVGDNERRYRLIFESSPVPLFIVDGQSLRFLAVNDTAVRTYGYTRNEFLGMTIFDIRPSEDVAALKRNLNRELQGVVDQGVWRHQRKDGTVFMVSVHAEQVTWEGRPARLSTAFDVDDLIETQNRLQDTQYLFETAQKAANIGWWHHILPENKLIWSSQTYEIFGVPPKDFTGRSEDFYRHIHPEDQVRVSAEVQAAMDRGEPYLVEYRIIRPDGKIRWVQSQGDLVRDATNVPLRMVGLCQDITRRKLYEQALRRVSEAVSAETGDSFFRTLVQQLAAAIDVSCAFVGELTEDGELVRTLAVAHGGVIVDNFEYHLKDTPCDVVRRDKGLCVYPRDAARQFPGDQLLCTMRMEAYAGISLTRPDGTMAGILVVLHASPFADEVPVGEILRIFASRASAELQRRRIEHALRESERRLDQALRSAELGVWDWDVQTGRVYFDDRWCAMLGYERDEIEPHVSSREKLVHPDDMPIVQVELHRHLKGQSSIYRTEHRVRTKDGRWMWILEEGRVVQRDEQGNPVRATGTHKDIDARKRAELANVEWKKRYEAAIHASGRLLYDWDSKTDGVTWAGDAVTTLGYATEELGNLEHWQSLIHPEDLPSFQRELDRVQETRAPFMLEYRVRHKAGHWIDLEDSGYFIESGSPGDGYRMVGFLTDVTQRNADARERDKLSTMLMQVQKLEAIGKLAASVAHDFNNLLTAIRGHLALARRQTPSGGLVEPSLDMIEKATQQGVDMTRALLSFAHQVPTKMTEIDLAQIVAEAAGLFESLLPSTVVIQTDHMPSGPVWVNADRSQMHQVLLNLVVNSRDAMPDGGVIRISLAKTSGIDDDPPMAVLTVSDEGMGMDQTTISHVFEPFFSTKERGKGTGLGLAIVHGIVTQHRGKIDVRSRPGEGTTFRVEFPVVTPDSLQPASPPPSPVEDGLPIPRRALTTVLVANGDVFLREILVTALESAGYRVVAVPGVPGVQQYQPDSSTEHCVAVVDLEMADPVRPLVERIRSRHPAIAAILLTSQKTPIHTDGVERVEIITRPFKVHELVKLLDDMSVAARVGTSS